MDKRASTRYEVSLNALVHPSVGRSWLCQIQDFCDAGMLLVEQNGRPRRALPGINAGEAVGIHFSVPIPGKEQHFRLEGKIVRAMETGVGISFANGMPDDAFRCLSEHSGLKPAKPDLPEKNSGAADSSSSKDGASSTQAAFRPRGIKPDDARAVIATLRKEVAEIIPEMTAGFFGYMDNELLELAKNAKSNAEQSEYFAAMSSFEKGKKQVGEEFLNQVLNQIDEPRDLQTLLEERKAADEARKAKSQKKVKLTLVNTEEFEDWLAIANIIQRSERMYEKYLDELMQRMGMIVDSWSHAEANPLGTSVISHAFESAIQQVELSKEIRQKVYTGYENLVIPLFRKLYISSTKLMEDSGFFPDLDEDYISSNDEDEQKGVDQEPEEIEELVEEEIEEETPDEDDFEELIDLNEDATESEPEPEADEVDDFEAEEDDFDEDFLPPPPRSRRRSASAQTQPAPAPKRSSRRRAGRQPVQSEPVQAEQRARPERIDDVGEAIRSIYSSVRNLMAGNFGQTEEQYDDADVDYFEAEEVQDLLSTLEDEMMAADVSGQRVPVRERLLQTASLVGGRRVAPETMRNIEVVENLVDTIDKDAMITGSSKNWIRQLELTLNKVAARDNEFLNEKNPHSSMEVLNQLASLGGAGSGSAKRAVDQIIEEVNTGYDEDPEVFDRALSKLQPLVERQNRAFTGNVQRTVKASQGQQTLVNAQRAVVSEMDTRYAGRQIPEVFYKLLMPGWRNLLVNTHLRQGEDSADWKKHVRALDQVFQYLDPDADPSSSAGYMEPEELLSHIEGGLDSISYEPGQRIPLINSLKEVIAGDVAPGDLPTVSLEDHSLAEDLGFSDVTEIEESRRKIREGKADDRNWQRSLEKAQNLHMGAWLEFTEKAEPEISIVAWISDEVTQFVFVNRRGVKTHDLTVEDLATFLQQGTARVLEESDIPLTDRASHRMLQNMHNQLTHQATHDDLTGLLNRKEFERELEIAVEDSMRTDAVHLCAYLDLDQFKVINNTGGHEAGDKLLIIIAELLSEKLAARDVRLSRLGGDEFGILILNCDADQGGQLMKSISDHVKAIRFDWEKDTFSLTVSCGLFYISQGTESTTDVMSGADSALIAAKEAGRDRIQEYKEDDSAMASRKDIMEFVSTIDRALDEDRFILNCQKIQPIDPDNPDVHYEILLTILSEDDEPLPPQDFIVAAEQYNRMGAVDRWVIRNAFKFISTNMEKLDDLGAFSINISGNSLTEPDFMEFVLGQFNETGLPTSKVCFEITETAAIGNLDDVVEFMEKMKVIGVHFSLDDFGTGLSSYSYLRSLPVDYLKIDGIFVKDIKNNPSDYAVVKSINEIGHFMGKKTIAEYVEDDEILEILREIGVDYAQGWGVGMKVPIVQLLD